MARFRLLIDLGYDVCSERAEFVFGIHAATALASQRVVSEQLLTTPMVSTSTVEEADRCGTRLMRLTAPRGLLTVHYDATIELAPIEGSRSSASGFFANDLPVKVLPYVSPSRHCQSGHAAALARREFGHLSTREERIEAIHRWITEHVKFAMDGAKGRLAIDIVEDASGVCRDFAHLMIAFYRTFGIPARLVSGIDCDVEPTASRPGFRHYVEVFFNGGWQLFDPQAISPPRRLIRIGTGRDVADIPIVSIVGDAKVDVPVVHFSEVQEASPPHGRSHSVPLRTSPARP